MVGDQSTLYVLNYLLIVMQHWVYVAVYAANFSPKMYYCYTCITLEVKILTEHVSQLIFYSFYKNTTNEGIAMSSGLLSLIQ